MTVLRALLAIAPPSNWQPIIERFFWRLDLDLRFGHRSLSLSEIEEVLALGGPIQAPDRYFKAMLRRLLLQLEEWNAKQLFRLLANPAHMERAAFFDLISHAKLAARYSTWSPHHGPDRKLMTELAQTRGAPAAIRRMARERIMRTPQAQTTLRDTDGRRTVSREELYELVWSEPMFTLAKRFGLSDNGLRKRCKAMQVPTPEQGYWQALKSGQRPRRTPLKPI